MGKGHEASVQCCFCGRSVPYDKATKVRRSSFSYFDERMGIRHSGAIMYEYCCVKCARRRRIEDHRQRQSSGRRPRKRY